VALQQDLAKVAAEERPSPASGVSGFNFLLASFAGPMAISVVFAAVNGACAWLLGHPWIGTAGFAVTCVVDFSFQRLIAHWRADPKVEQRVGFGWLSVAAAARNAVLVGTPTLMALRGGAPEQAYLLIIVCCLAALANIYGALSRQVFWGCIVPPLAAVAWVTAAKIGGLPALGVGVALAMLGLLLGLISENIHRGIGQWYQAYVASVALNKDLAAARDDARQASIAKSNFLATMSHEIRTPLNGILGIAQLLEREEQDPLRAQQLNTLLGCGEHLLSILGDILDATKIDAGRIEIEERIEALGPYLADVTTFWRGRADEKGLSLQLEVSSAVPERAWIDPRHLRQVLFNLIGNALKFTEAGSVAVTADLVRAAGGEVLSIAVRDTGPGIAAESLPLLFERFSQADATSTRRFGGTGLGLAIARQLTELMGGQLTLTSEVGVGSIFRVELPLRAASAEDAAAALATPAAAGAGPEATPYNLTPARAAHSLVVDDNPTNLLVLDSLLSALGQQVCRAASGAEALERLAERPFDMVWMDIQMPEMTGDEALAQLRRTAGPNRATPVVAVTADVTSGGADYYRRLGFDGHCAKPVKIDDLVREIENLSRPSPGRQTPLRA
jgi:signal transduction histidine kinase/CheY-like chemotaxis protein